MYSLPQSVRYREEPKVSIQMQHMVEVMLGFLVGHKEDDRVNPEVERFPNQVVSLRSGASRANRSVYYDTAF
jgi:hypothetical protein